MELAVIRVFEPQMAEIDLFTMPNVGETTIRKKETYRILDNLGRRITDIEGNKITYK